MYHTQACTRFFLVMQVDESTPREWIANIASRQADQRMGHLFCELLVRSRAAGLTNDHGFVIPLTQQQVGEAMGITPVHTNRVISKLRQEELISWENTFLKIHDWKRMKEVSDFDANY